MINTDEGFYEGLSIKFLGIPAQDFPTYKLSQHFTVAADYIDNVLKNKGFSAFIIQCFNFLNKNIRKIIESLQIYLLILFWEFERERMCTHLNVMVIP